MQLCCVLYFLETIMAVEVVGAAEEEVVGVTTNKRGVTAAEIEEVGVVKTAHSIAELRTSENEGKMHYNNYYGLAKYR